MENVVYQAPAGVNLPAANHIVIKTLAGIKALQSRSTPPPARMTALLRLADGKHSVVQIVQADGRADALVQLQQLMQLGWLQPYAPADTQPVPVVNAAMQAAAVATTAAQPSQPASINAAQRCLVDWAVKAMGPDSSVSLALQIERTSTRAELQALLERMCAMFSGIMSRESIHQHQQEALRLLGLQGQHRGRI
jgi:hypothetical protein